MAVPEIKRPGLFGLLKPYKGSVALLVLVTLIGNAFSLAVPTLVAHMIDAAPVVYRSSVIIFVLVALGIFVFLYSQTVLQIFVAERVARDMRERTADKISRQQYRVLEEIGSGKLLTNLTSDADSVKTFVSQAVPSLVSSVFVIVGASALLLISNWKLALPVLLALPIIGAVFMVIFSRVRALFKRAQEAIDWLNRVTSESILGAALVRLSNAQSVEFDKFVKANSDARDIGYSILKLFATLIPIITFVTNIATLVILVLGGHFVIGGSMTLGQFTAFNSYLSILIFPVFVLGFTSSVIGQAGASYGRIGAVLFAPETKEEGNVVTPLSGQIEVRDVSFVAGDKKILDKVCFKVTPGSKTAIVGPTAAGKTTLLYILIGLLYPTEGEVLYDGVSLKEYDKEKLHEQIGFVFQDSSVFNMSLRENIAFSRSVTSEDLARAIKASELEAFIESLPEGLETNVAERGTTLSGGQKQRLMLARALAVQPRILFLDDFTARVDIETERRILENISTLYPGLTLISVTQKIHSIESYNEVVLLMEGEMLARGTHTELLESSPEYAQIYESQQSTETITA